MNQRERSARLSRCPQGCMWSQDGVSGECLGIFGESDYVRSQEGQWKMSSPAWRLPQGWRGTGGSSFLLADRSLGLSAADRFQNLLPVPHPPHCKPNTPSPDITWPPFCRGSPKFSETMLTMLQRPRPDWIARLSSQRFVGLFWIAADVGKAKKQGIPASCPWSIPELHTQRKLALP